MLTQLLSRFNSYVQYVFLYIPGIGPALFKYVPDQAAGNARYGTINLLPLLNVTCISLLSKHMHMYSTFHYPIYLSGWVARKSIRLYADKKYRCHFLAMLGHEAPADMSLASVSGRRNEEEEEEMEMAEIKEREVEEEHEEMEEPQDQQGIQAEQRDGEESREAGILEREEEEVEQEGEERTL